MFSYKKKVKRRNKLRLALTGIWCALGIFVIAPLPVWGSVSSISLQSAPDSREPLTAASATSRPAYERFLSAAEALYDAVNKGSLEEALSGLSEIELQFRNLPMKGIATADGIRALAGSITEMKRTAAAFRPDEQKWKSGAAALRLAADALAHPDKPIWQRYRTVIQEDIMRIRENLPQGTTVTGPVAESALLAFNQLTEHYRVIRTAAMLHSEPWKVERSDSVIRYASRIYHADSPTAQLLQGTIPPLKEAMEGLFPVNKEASTAVVPPIAVSPPSWGWSAMMGSFIVTILTWVGWKRYKVDGYSGKSKGPEQANESEDAAQRWLKKWKK